MTLQPGSHLGGYRIDRLLGRGGMGSVYLAQQLDLGRSVALKLLAPELATSETFRERFVRESRLAAALDHPNVVPIYEAGEADGELFIAMRYVEGSDLDSILRREGRLEPERAIRLLLGVADALDAAHGQNLVHRDVKPGNILVARGARGGEHAYLSDFGLTKRKGSGTLTRTGEIVGSVDYVAPEQIEGRPLDGRADVYSLACVLYACLTGRAPYERDSDIATLWAHVQADVPSASLMDPALAPYDPVLAAGMAKDVALRTREAGELMAAAANVLDSIEHGNPDRLRHSTLAPLERAGGSTATRPRIRVGVVDDHPSIVAAVSSAIAATDDLVVAGTGGSLEDALDLAGRVDVLACDVQLDGGAEGLRLLEVIRDRSDRPAVLLLSGFGHASVIRAAIDRGAAGYLDKGAEMAAIVDAIRTVAAGGTVFRATDLEAWRSAPRRPSDRELEVIAAVVGGATNGEVALRLSLSEKTVETHLHRLFDRYGLLSRTELAVLAVNEGWAAGPGGGTS